MHLQKEGRVYKDDLIRIVTEANKLLSKTYHLYLFFLKKKTFFRKRGQPALFARPPHGCRRHSWVLFESCPIFMFFSSFRQYYDLIKILEVGGNPETTKFYYYFLLNLSKMKVFVPGRFHRPGNLLD